MNIVFAKGGPRFPKTRVALQAHMPAVHPEMTIWGVKGGPPHFLGAKSYSFCYLERYAKIQNCSVESSRLPIVHAITKKNILHWDYHSSKCPNLAYTE